MKVRIFVIAATALILGLVSFPPESWAGFRVCNRSDQTVHVAIGYYNKDYGWMSEGWWTVHSGDCDEIIEGNLHSRYYYVYADGDDGGVWDADKGQDGGFFCVSHAKFTLRNSDFLSGSNIDCEKGGQTTKQFYEVDTKEYVNFTHTLR